MQLTPKEVPFSQSEDAASTPAYVDERVVVYSLPIIPVLATPGVDHSVPSKRKRTPSPDAPAKRSSTSDGVSTDSNTDSIYDTDPQAWRRMMISQMFPFEAPEASTSTKKAARKERRMRGSYGLVGMPLPDTLEPVSQTPQADYNTVRARRAQRLPTFTYGPEGKPTLCYVLVGPTGRGRFDVAKAEALGVPRGPVRGQLTKGETITFSVDDGHGNKIERTVKPEDVVGPPEVPRARGFRVVLLVLH